MNRILLVLLFFRVAVWADTNTNTIVLFKTNNWENIWFTNAPYVRPTNAFEGRLDNIVRVSNRWHLDWTATNLEMTCSHEPVLLGKSNGQWRVRFK